MTQTNNLPTSTKKWKHLQQNVEQFFEKRARENNCSVEEAKKATPKILIFYLISIVSLITFGTLWMIYGNYYYSILFGFSIWFGSATSVHDGLHKEIGSFYGINLDYWLPLLFGWLHCNPLTWKLQHMKGHHLNPNLKNDVDIWAFPPWAFRVSRLTPKNPFGKILFLLFPIIIFTTGLGPNIFGTIRILRFGNFRDFCQKFDIEKGKWMLALLQLCVLLSLFLFGFWNHGILSTTLIYYTHGTLYFIFSQISHVNEESQHDEKNVKNLHWLELQRNAAHGDYSVHSKFWMFLSIGLNSQSIHHMFPDVHWCHYSDIYKILEDFEGKKVTKTFLQSVTEWARFIWRINQWMPSSLSPFFFSV